MLVLTLMRSIIADLHHRYGVAAGGEALASSVASAVEGVLVGASELNTRVRAKIKDFLR